jgi:hypothetical protein
MATAPAVVNDNGMTDSELASLLAQHETQAIGYFDSEIANEQAKAINYYYGLMDDLPALDGCSSAVDNSVAIMVDNALAAVLKPFVSADEVVSFEPRGPEDVAQAEQATDYVNYVINCDNPGFIIFHNWFKDALLTKIGVVKAWWEDTSRQTVQQVPVDELQLLQARQDPNYLGEQQGPDGMYIVDLQQMEEDGRVKVEGVPPEEFLISQFARSIEDAPYCAHRPASYTRSDLIEMGVDREVVDSLPAKSSSQAEETRTQARYRDEDYTARGDMSGSDKSRDLIAVLDEYVRVDFDGDGVSELRRVVRVEDVILLNEPVEEAPFALLCPCPMPHKVYGRALADQAVEGQKIATAILRQTLDNLYKSNNPRPVVPDTAVNESTFDDIGDSSPGAAIRVKAPAQLDWMTVPFTAQHSFPMLEYNAQQIEERTGIQRKGNGFNAEALKKNSPDTATQAAIDENSRNERAEMIARIFAETGVKRLFKLILGLLVRHQPKARMIRLRNQWVDMDPSGWSPEMDVSISVGLGVGNKAEQISQANTVLQTMAELQQTPYAYLLKPEHVHKAVQRLYTAAGIKNVDDYIADPEQVEAPEPQPDPEMAKAQAQMQIEQAKMQASQQVEAAKMQAKQQSDMMSIQLEQAKAQAQIQLEREKAAAQAQVEAVRMQLDQARAQFEAQLALRESEQQFAIERAKLEMARELGREKVAAQSASGKERPGGKLNK